MQVSKCAQYTLTIVILGAYKRSKSQKGPAGPWVSESEENITSENISKMGYCRFEAV